MYLALKLIYNITHILLRILGHFDCRTELSSSRFTSLISFLSIATCCEDAALFKKLKFPTQARVDFKICCHVFFRLIVYSLNFYEKEVK